MKKGAGLQKGYTVEEAATITRVKPSTIRYWVGPYGKTAITAEVADTGRQGSRKLLSLRNLVQIRVAFLASAARWPQTKTARLLREAFTERRLDWFTPGQRIFGAVDWLYLLDRPGGEKGPFWRFKSIGAAGTPGQTDWLGAALSAHLGDFDVITIQWPGGWKPVTEDDVTLTNELIGVRRLTVLNLVFIRQWVEARV